MRYKEKLKLTGLVVLTVSALTGIQAQQTIAAAAGNISVSSGSVSYTIGQVVYSTVRGSNGSAAQGVQQPFEISIVTGIDQAELIHILSSVYPNPTEDFLTLMTENCDPKELWYQLSDQNGRLLEYSKVTGNRTRILMSDYLPAVYFIKVLENQKEIKTFKIIKK